MRILIILLFLCASSLNAIAQESFLRQVYTQAENDYNLGRIEQASTALLDNMKAFQGNLRESSIRLLVLCWLGLDETEKAEEWTAKLLAEDPYYTASSQDPQRFIDLVENIKRGLTATITTASSHAESLAEVPVPTTLITEEMIHNCGGQNLQEVLAAYVPGMNIIDCNDDINIALRGIYSNSQEKILIMLNGHRMNSYCTNIASPDFSVSLEKIKQIEVLRGPASSLYGGVALTGVVNIITKHGADLDGVKVKAAIGNYGQMRGDLIFGKRYFDLDLLIWGSIYKNSGEKKNVEEERMEEDIYMMPLDHFKIGRIGNKPSHDIGIQMKWKDLQFLYDAQFSQVIAPFTISTLAKTYDFDKYKTLNGYSPSYSTSSHHLDLSYSRQFDKLYLKGNIAYDNSDLTHYQVISDNSFEQLGQLMGLDEDDPKNIFANPGLFRYINGQEQNYSFQLKGDYSYINRAHHSGNLSFGTEFSHFQLEDVRYALGYNFVMIAPENPMIPESGKGHENSYNAFLQLKHQWRSIILNAGLRYDDKKRADGRTLNEFSPRVAMILMQPKWNIKFSYSKSFVDAPYLYRKTNELLPLLTGDGTVYNFEVLEPEFVNSLQLTFAGFEWAKGFNFEINGFYNQAKDLIITHIIQHLNEAENKTLGIELMASYRKPKFTADFNLTWTNTFKSNLFTKSIDANNNTPAITSNATLSWKAAPKLKLFSNIVFESKMTSYNINTVQMIRFQQLYNIFMDLANQNKAEEAEEFYPLLVQAQERLILETDMKARAIFNVGAEYQMGKVTIGLNVRNLFNTKYDRSGMNTKLIPQKGRWFMFEVAYKF
jgi:iron complex outermembrane receptor protein